MKTHVPAPLRTEDIKPYTIGINVLEYTSSDSGEHPSDVFVGDIEKITYESACDLITAITITMKWIVRLRKPLEADNPPEYYEPFEKSRKYNCGLTFLSPQLLQKRSPLTFKSDNAVVKISHVTKLAKVVWEIEHAHKKS